MRLKISAICLVLFSIPAYAQLQLEGGVKAHKDIDNIYAQFSLAYKNLDIDQVSNLYSEDASYLAPDSAIRNGRANIRQSFADYFNWARKERASLEISFQILKREVEKKLGFDIGIYTIWTLKEGKEISRGSGKFVVVTKKIGKKWFFQVDGYSGLEPKKNQ